MSVWPPESELHHLFARIPRLLQLSLATGEMSLEGLAACRQNTNRIRVILRYLIEIFRYFIEKSQASFLQPYGIWVPRLSACEIVAKLSSYNSLTSDWLLEPTIGANPAPLCENYRTCELRAAIVSFLFY